MTAPTMLFGLHDWEHLESDLNTVVDKILDEMNYGTLDETERAALDSKRYEIEEYSTCDCRRDLPDPNDLLERVVEDVCDNAEGDEFYCDDWERASKNVDVLEAMRSTLNLLASKVTYRMADRRVAVHQLTFVGGKPHIAGKPWG